MSKRKELPILTVNTKTYESLRDEIPTFVQLTKILEIYGLDYGDVTNFILSKKFTSFSKMSMEEFIGSLATRHDEETGVNYLVLSQGNKNIEFALLRFTDRNGADLNFINAYRKICSILNTLKIITTEQEKYLFAVIQSGLMKYSSSIEVKLLDEMKILSTSLSSEETQDQNQISSFPNLNEAQSNVQTTQDNMFLTQEQFMSGVTSDLSRVFANSSNAENQNIDWKGFAVLFAISILGMVGGFSLVENSDETSKILLKIFSIPSLSFAIYAAMQVYLFNRNK